MVAPPTGEGHWRPLALQLRLRATGAANCTLFACISMLRTMASTCRIALCQIMAGSDKAANLGVATEAIARAAEAHRANIVALPECFNRCVNCNCAVAAGVRTVAGHVCAQAAALFCSPYATDQFPIYAEPIPKTKAELDPAVHPSSAALSAAAEKHKVYLIGGELVASTRAHSQRRGTALLTTTPLRPDCLQAPSPSGMRAARSTTRALCTALTARS